MGKEYKVTVKHYLNVDKRIQEREQGVYPLYVKVTYKRKNYTFKSGLKYNGGYFYDLEFAQPTEKSIIESEKRSIIKVIPIIERVGIEINAKNIKHYSESLISVLDASFWRLYRDEWQSFGFTMPALLWNSDIFDLTHVVDFFPSFEITDDMEIAKDVVDSIINEMDIDNMGDSNYTPLLFTAVCNFLEENEFTEKLYGLVNRPKEQVKEMLEKLINYPID